ncbi:hypothetical protein DFH06DRAFT_1109345 [Mycena polygramma]|nr:hypothetical protein DFH06DRAFT_1109345 [Mycena polygramma]
MPPAGPGDAGYGAVGFLPTTLPADPAVPWAASPHSLSLSASTSSKDKDKDKDGHHLLPPVQPRAAYGLLSPARDAVLGLGDAARLVGTLCAALERTGVATPFVFSALALDVRRAGVVRLVNAFLPTCRDSSGNSRGGAGAEEKWQEEARFAGAHELGMCLRWGLSRVVRVEGGREVRGLLSWAWYERWRAEEGANAYPTTAFSTLLASLPAQIPPILAPLFALCTRLVAHSNSSGHTPPSLAAILSPLLFGLTPPGGGAPAPIHSSPFEYLRGARAAEHLLLASIREGISSAEGRGLGAPTRLREWVGMYPASLDLGGKPTGPRRGAKTMRVVHVRRNVRSYSADLVRGGSSWAGGGSSASGQNDWAASKAWRAIIAGGAGSPRYAESYRKRLDLGVGVHPSTSSLASNYSSSSSTSTAPTTYGLAASSSANPAPSTTSLSSEDSGGAFRSLTDLKWGEFESLGFGGGGAGAVGGGAKEGGIDGRLRFDLTENARAERLAKRETLSWNDFSTAGFSRSDAPLSATLQFAPPLTLSSGSNSNSKELNAELTRKLRKAHKALPAFGWDTNPVLGPEEVVEEAFLDVFCDLLWGGGWMERASGVGGSAAELARECSWALVEYKSRTTAAQDPGTTLVLFEEFVPREYRLALAGAAPPGTRRRLPALFSPSSPPTGGKTWKQAQTLNGRPYVLGATPTVTGSTRELDFDSMLRAQGGTKVLSLGAKQQRAMSTGPLSPELAKPLARAGSHDTQDSSDGSAERGGGKEGRRLSTRFRLPGGMIPGPSPGNSGGRARGMLPAEYAAVDFETRLAGESDDEGDADETSEAERQRRRESASDAWVDILVGSTQARRMGGQDAEMTRGSGRRRAAFVAEDPDLKGLEAAQALAAATIGREMSPDPEMEEMERRREQRARQRAEEHLRDSDVVDVEHVPRTSEQSDRSEYDDDGASEGYGAQTDEEEDNLTPNGTAQLHPVLTQRQEARQQRRLGYFDLHPERRPPSVSTQDDDPRSLLSATDSDDEHDAIPVRNLDIDPVPRNLDIPVRPLPTPTGPTHVSPHARSKADSVILTPTNGAGSNGHASPNPIAQPKPATPSKTSALIDMFRERESKGTPAAKPTPAAAAPAPSRIPLRTGTLPVPAPAPAGKAPAPLPKTPPAPAAVSLPKSPAPPAAPASPPLLDPAAIVPPPLLAVDSGRGSPARYVHGAPLHNVLEEEEEET